MIALGLDPSLRSFGFAILDSSASGRARRIASGHEGTSSKIVSPARYQFFQKMVGDLLRKYPAIEVIGIESPAYGAGPFQTVHFALLQFALVEAFAARRDVVLFDPATREYLVREDPKLKKGKMSKLDIQRYVQFDTMDPKIIDNNEADAYVIAKFASRFRELQQGKIKPSELTPAEEQKFILMTRKVKILGSVREQNTAHAFRANSRFFEFSKVESGSVNLPEKSEVSKYVIQHKLEKGKINTL